MKPLRNKFSYVKRLGKVQREMLTELSGGDLLYGFLVSARSTKRMFKHARERATYRHRRKLVLQRLIDERFVRMNEERLSMTLAGRNAPTTQPIGHTRHPQARSLALGHEATPF